METKYIDSARLIRSAERTMLDFSELCGKLHLAAPVRLFPDNVALTEIFDESRLCRLIYGCRDMAGHKGTFQLQKRKKGDEK